MKIAIPTSRGGKPFFRRGLAELWKDLIEPGHIATLSVPDHREVARGTLRALIRLADLTAEQFARNMD